MARIDEADHEPQERIEARLHKMVQRWTEASGYRLNPEREVVDGIVRALARSAAQHGVPYCPCRDLTGDREADKGNICPCDYHRDEIARDNHCKCVLFVGADYDPAVAYAPLVAAAGETLPAIRRRWLTLYSTRWCALSRRVRTWLQQEKLPFEEHDLEDDPAAARQVETWTGGYRSVPTVVVRQVVNEPTPTDLQALLASPAALMQCTLYITRWCAYSRRAMAWLRQHDITATIVDIEADADAAARVREWNGGFMSVPTLDLSMRLVEPRGDQLARALGMASH